MKVKLWQINQINMNININEINNERWRRNVCDTFSDNNNNSWSLIKIPAKNQPKQQQQRQQPSKKSAKSLEEDISGDPSSATPPSLRASHAAEHELETSSSPSPPKAPKDNNNKLTKAKEDKEPTQPKTSQAHVLKIKDQSSEVTSAAVHEDLPSDEWTLVSNSKFVILFLPYRLDLTCLSVTACSQRPAVRVQLSHTSTEKRCKQSSRSKSDPTTSSSTSSTKQNQSRWSLVQEAKGESTQGSKVKGTKDVDREGTSASSATI